MCKGCGWEGDLVGRISASVSERVCVKVTCMTMSYLSFW